MANLSEADRKIIDAAGEREFIFHRQPDGSLRSSSQYYPARQPCALHGPYDAGLDGCCVHCYQKIASRTVIIISD